MSRGAVPAALGLRAHSGWAALVAVAGSLRSPAVIERRRIELADPGDQDAKQPFHAAEGLDLERAEEIVGRSVRDARQRAGRALRAVLDDVCSKGHEIVACAILLGSGRPATSLAATLASHALIHTAEGDLFRDALRHASGQCGVPVTGIKERELLARAAAELGVPEDEIQRRFTEVGKPLGPPWRQDEKLAALAGWLALAPRG